MAERYPWSRVGEVEFWPEAEDHVAWGLDVGFIYERDHFGDPIPGSIVVAVDGSCRNNGRYGAEAGCGIFFGPDSIYNQSQVLYSQDATSARAELRAAIEGLKAVHAVISDPYCFQEVLQNIIIKSDSEYVVKGITGGIYTWMDQGRVIANMDLWEELLDIVDDTVYSGISVSFWQVPRRFNQDADMLAKCAWDY